VVGKCLASSLGEIVPSRASHRPHRGTGFPAPKSPTSSVTS
jgi:hypothetical protein